jgi:hypothetical protein
MHRIQFERHSSSVTTPVIVRGDPTAIVDHETMVFPISISRNFAIYAPSLSILHGRQLWCAYLNYKTDSYFPPLLLASEFQTKLLSFSPGPSASNFRIPLNVAGSSQARSTDPYRLPSP